MPATNVQRSAVFSLCDCCRRDWCGCTACPDCAEAYRILGFDGTAANSPPSSSPPLSSSPSSSSSAPALLLSGRTPGFPGWITEACLRVAPSGIKGAGQGLFSSCRMRKGQVVKRPYQGKRVEKGSWGADYDHSYLWCPERPPRVFAPHSSDEDAEEVPEVVAPVEGPKPLQCLDARDFKDPGTNPVRFVNGAKSQEQCDHVGLEFCQFDQQLYFRTTRDLRSGEELLVDYGASYWEDGTKCRPKLSRSQLRRLHNIFDEKDE